MTQYFFAQSDGARHQLFPGVEAHVVWGSRLMLSVVYLQPHAQVDEHSHPHEQMGMVLEGRAEFTIGGETRVLGPGDMYLMPSGVRHKVIAFDAPVRAIDVFNPPREEYK
jgi:quercetin dioxygenase-like cupin family protein